MGKCWRKPEDYGNPRLSINASVNEPKPYVEAEEPSGSRRLLCKHEYSISNMPVRGADKQLKKNHKRNLVGQRQKTLLYWAKELLHYHVEARNV